MTLLYAASERIKASPPAAAVSTSSPPARSRGAYRTWHCILPVDVLFEREQGAEGETAHAITMKDGRPFDIGGDRSAEPKLSNIDG
jgi:hypothetical protein